MIKNSIFDNWSFSLFFYGLQPTDSENVHVHHFGIVIVREVPDYNLLFVCFKINQWKVKVELSPLNDIGE